MNVSIREFTRKIYEYLKPGEYFITVRGSRKLKVIIIDYKDVKENDD